MNSRIEKHVSDGAVKTRTERNNKLYNDVSDNLNIDVMDIDVDNAIELDSDGISKPTRENYMKKRELEDLVGKPLGEENVVETHTTIKPDKIYDINEILKLAKEDKLFEDEEKKRLINTEYNILTKLDIEDIDKEDIKKEDIKSLINDIYEQEIPKKIKKYSRKEEEDLLNDLITNDSRDTIGESLNLKEELSEEILEKESEDKEELKEENNTKIDTTGFDTIFANTKEKEKEGKGLIVAIIIVTILILLTVAFFVIDYFFGLKI